nr:hypothetical protein Iba_chr01fCG0620 [Ipomoea batatas]
MEPSHPSFYSDVMMSNYKCSGIKPYSYKSFIYKETGTGGVLAGLEDVPCKRRDVVEAPQVHGTVLSRIGIEGWCTAVSFEIWDIEELHLCFKSRELFRQLFDSVSIACQQVVGTRLQTPGTSVCPPEIRIVEQIASFLGAEVKWSIIREIHLSFLSPNPPSLNIISPRCFFSSVKRSKPDTNTFPWITDLSSPFSPRTLPDPPVLVLPLPLGGIVSILA